MTCPSCGSGRCRGLGVGTYQCDGCARIWAVLDEQLQAMARSHAAELGLQRPSLVAQQASLVVPGTVVYWVSNENDQTRWLEVGLVVNALWGVVMEFDPAQFMPGCFPLAESVDEWELHRN